MHRCLVSFIFSDHAVADSVWALEKYHKVTSDVIHCPLGSDSSSFDT